MREVASLVKGLGAPHLSITPYNRPVLQDRHYENHEGLHAAINAASDHELHLVTDSLFADSWLLKHEPGIISIKMDKGYRWLNEVAEHARTSNSQVLIERGRIDTGEDIEIKSELEKHGLSSDQIWIAHPCLNLEDLSKIKWDLARETYGRVIAAWDQHCPESAALVQQTMKDRLPKHGILVDTGVNKSIDVIAHRRFLEI